MSRPLRIQYEGALYHVMHRGASKQAIFLSEEHRTIFLDLLSDIHKLFQVEIQAYCLMGNHYHLQIRTPHSNLSRAMRHLNGVYTQRFNLTTRRDGALFRGRYKSILVQDNQYKLRLSRYIHLNPTKANLVKHPDDYPWSSMMYYSGKTLDVPEWLFYDDILENFGAKQPHRNYLAYIHEGLDDETTAFYGEDKIKTPVFGETDFVKAVTEGFISKEAFNMEIPQEKWTVAKLHLGLDEMILKIATYLGVSGSQLKHTKGRHRHPKRDMIIYFLIVETEHSRLEVGKQFNLNSHMGISHCIARAKRELELPENQSLLHAFNVLLFGGKIEVYKC